MFRLASTLSVLSLALVSIGCAPNQSTIGQRITCQTDPDSGVITSCAPGDDDGTAGSCQDIDEDGDGLPHDDDDDSSDDDEGSGSGSGSGSDDLSFTGDDDGAGSGNDDGETSSDDCDEDGDGIDDIDDDDDDNDGILDDDDCDEYEGEDGDESELPYNIELARGASVTPIADAFAEKGAQPAAVLSVEMEGTSAGWRLAELQAGATFTVGDADCNHVGNRGEVGRDRVVVTWRNADGTVESDHMTLRYCGH